MVQDISGTGSELRWIVARLKYPLEHNQMPCNVKGGIWGCTRPKNHDGVHVAHVPDGRVVAIWENENDC